MRLSLKKITFLLCFSILSCPHVNAQLTDSLKKELQKASATLYAEENADYLIFDGIVDGLLQINQPYSISYNNEQFVFNDKTLAKSINKTYQDKFQNMHTGALKTWSTSKFAKRGHADLSKLLSTEFEVNSMKWQQKMNGKLVITPLVESLKKDGVIDYTRPYNIIYNNYGLSLNDTLIPSDLQEKYSHFMDSFKIKANDGFQYYFH